MDEKGSGSGGGLLAMAMVLAPVAAIVTLLILGVFFVVLLPSLFALNPLLMVGVMIVVAGTVWGGIFVVRAIIAERKESRTTSSANRR